MCEAWPGDAPPLQVEVVAALGIGFGTGSRFWSSRSALGESALPSSRHPHRIRFAEEMAPAFVAEAVFPQAEQRAPARSDRFVHRMHVRFVRQLVGFARIAADTRGDDIFPSRPAAFLPGNHVVEIELRLGQRFRAVLTGELVAQENVPPGELHLEPGDFLVKAEHDDVRHPHGEFDGVDEGTSRRGLRVVQPRAEVVGLELILAVGLDDSGVADADQVQGTTDTARLDGLPEAIEHQHRMFEQGIHTAFRTIVRNLPKLRISAIQIAVKTGAVLPGNLPRPACLPKCGLPWPRFGHFSLGNFAGFFPFHSCNAFCRLHWYG